MTTITPFLMFKGQAREAIALYCEAFPDAQIQSAEFYDAGELGEQGSVKRAVLTLSGQNFKLIDSAVPHEFNFSASTSFFIECESLQLLDQLFASLSRGGEVMMPPNNYGFSQRFAWLSDPFGVSWQLNFDAVDTLAK